MIYNNLYLLSDKVFIEQGNFLEHYKHNCIVYKFTVNGAEYKVSFFNDSSDKSCVIFSLIDSLNLNEMTNDNPHTVFSSILLIIEHYKNLTGVVDYKYQTKDQQKHNIFQMMATKLNVKAINTEEIAE
jgi:hypothetical protein